MSQSESDTLRQLREASHLIAKPFQWTTPNQLTLFGLLLTIPMVWSLLTGRQALASVLFITSMGTDFFDGALARAQFVSMTAAERAAQASRHFLVRRGPSEAGMSFDPFADKIRYFGALLPMGWHRLDRRLIVLSLVFAVILTFGRPLLIWLAKRVGRSYSGKSKLGGKVKAWTEFFLIVTLLLLAPLAPVTALSEFLLILATVSALASILSHLSGFRKVMNA